MSSQSGWKATNVNELPRSPISRFPGEEPPAIGHNQGPPLDPDRSWRAHCWRAARRRLAPRLPLEIVRRRVARAKALGLEYPQYASILLGTGRDVVAFLFTSDALGLRLERQLRIDTAARAKVARLQQSERLLFCRSGDEPALALAMLDASAQLPFLAAGRSPVAPATVPAGRTAIRGVLDPLRLPGDAVVMIGTERDERVWAEAARLAKFLPATAYTIGSTPE